MPQTAAFSTNVGDNDKKGKRHATVNLTPEVHEILRRLAKEREQSLSDVVADGLRELAAAPRADVVEERRLDFLQEIGVLPRVPGKTRRARAPRD